MKIIAIVNLKLKMFHANSTEHENMLRGVNMASMCLSCDRSIEIPLPPPSSRLFESQPAIMMSEVTQEPTTGEII
jgi:hypothetical protein